MSQKAVKLQVRFAWRCGLSFVVAFAACTPAADEADDALGWRVDETLRIGRLEGEGPDLFGAIRALEVDRSGRIWVLEQQAKELRVFDRAGGFVRAVGRPGGGPGEFVYPLGLTWDRAGRLMVADPRNTRISVFDTSGAYVTSHPMQGGFTINPSPARMDTAGNFYNFAPDVSVPEWRTVIVKFDTAMQPVDTLLLPESPFTREYFEYVSADGNDRGRTSVPFTPRLLWRLSPTGEFWAALTGSYTLVRLSGEGDTLARVTHPFAPVRVTSADVDSVLAELEEFRRLGGNVDASRIPDTKPAIDAFWVADDGDLWVAVTPDDPALTRRLIDIFSAEGTYRGRLTLPFAISTRALPIIRGDWIYAVTEDELEVQYVVVGHLVRGTS